MSKLVVDRPGIPVLGEDSRAEKLVNWSEKTPVGRKSTKKFPFGLTIHFVSNGSFPKMYIHWNPKRFSDWFKPLTLAERMCLVNFGITVDHYKGRTQVRLLGAGKTGHTLWDTDKSFCRQQSSPEVPTDVNWLLGMVIFGEKGPEFFDTPETQAEVKEAAALSVIDTSKRKVARTPGEVLPRKRSSLSPRAKAYLLTEALIGMNSKTEVR